MSDDSSTMSDDSSDDDGAREMALETADYVAAPFEPYSWAAVVLFDLIYKFRILKGTVEAPTQFQIIPDIKIPFTCLRLEVKGCLENRKYRRTDRKL
jgi:hypothetical protein